MLILLSLIALGSQPQPLYLSFFISLQTCTRPNIGALLSTPFQVSNVVKCQHPQPLISDLQYGVIAPCGIS